MCVCIFLVEILKRSILVLVSLGCLANPFVKPPENSRSRSHLPITYDMKNNIGLKNKIKKKGNKKEKMFNSNKVVLLQQRFKAFVAGQKSKTIKKCLQ